MSESETKLARRVATAALPLLGLSDDTCVKLLNVSENVTFLLGGAEQPKSILRVHRPHYHDQSAILSEHLWLEALSKDKVVPVSRPMVAVSGRTMEIVSDPESDQIRNVVRFEFIDGQMPSATDALEDGFCVLGSIAAKLHQHAKSWSLPKAYTRSSWDLDSILGVEAIWGDWRNAPNHTQETLRILEDVENRLRERLSRFGADPMRFGLIHADMRLANLLQDGPNTYIIDFDDCGFGWFLYDFAAAVSFIEDDPRLPQLKVAWIDGYRSIAPLTSEEEAEVASFVMLRRLALLAWVGSRAGAPEPDALAPDFARVSAELGQRYLTGTLL